METMPDILSHLPDLAMRSTFLGFVFWTICWATFRVWRIFQYDADQLDKLAIGAVLVAGYIGVFWMAVQLLTGVQQPDGELTQRAFGIYWYGYWIYPITYSLIPQLLWLERVRNSKAIRITMSVWIFLVVHIHPFIVMVTSLHREYAMGSEHTSVMGMLTSIVASWMVGGLVFFAYLALAARIAKRNP